ncbi:MAG: sel1 repeat family protein, partial [Bacteroidaceae bacterium]|nr:sel1 repeat family protein [Bacteroidaceae bacterium]
MEKNDKATYLYQLGARYYWGDDNTERDLDKAIEYLQKAADMGHDNAQNLLGICFETGEGVEQNHEKAIELYTKASKQGNEYAPYNLARYYGKGEGIEQDYEKAVELYTEAARRGYSKAQ